MREKPSARKRSLWCLLLFQRFWALFVPDLGQTRQGIPFLGLRPSICVSAAKSRNSRFARFACQFHMELGNKASLSSEIYSSNMAHYAVARLGRLTLFETRVTLRVQLNAIGRDTEVSENPCGSNFTQAVRASRTGRSTSRKHAVM